MKPATIRLLDLGIDEAFATSMGFAQSTIGSLTVGWEDHPAAEVEYVRTRDWWTVAEALRAPAAVIHVMAHGNDLPEDVSFSSHGGSALALDELAEYFAEGGGGISAAAILADACRTGTGRFKKAIRNCLAEPVAYIGTRRSVDWHESTTYASAFYAAYFRSKGRGTTPQKRALDAAARANSAYRETIGAASAFTAEVLTPSATAQRAFG